MIENNSLDCYHSTIARFGYEVEIKDDFIQARDLDNSELIRFNSVEDIIYSANNRLNDKIFSFFIKDINTTISHETVDLVKEYVDDDEKNAIEFYKRERHPADSDIHPKVSLLFDSNYQLISIEDLSSHNDISFFKNLTDSEKIIDSLIKNINNLNITQLTFKEKRDIYLIFEKEYVENDDIEKIDFWDMKIFSYTGFKTFNLIFNKSK